MPASAAAQRHDVDPLATIHQALVVIALEHLEPGQQVMTESHRLRDLQVSETGHDGIGLAGRQFRRHPNKRCSSV